jgi:hypothetical protein
MSIFMTPCGRMLNVASEDGFVTTWLIEEGDKTITLPLRTGFTYDMTVDWGDGSTSEITAWDDADITHNYATAGTKTVSITGTCEAWYFNNSGDKLKFRTVENWGDVGFTGAGLENAFQGCSNATDFGTEMPAYTVTSLSQTWRGCSSATSFPDVSALTSVTSLSSTWFGCSLATSFPDVNALTSVNTLSYTWFGCSSMTTVPVLPSASTALTTTTLAFRDVGSGMGGTVSDLWNATDFPNITAYANTFTGCTGLTNYADIPDGWKGL